jgi:hypothetical protein
MCKISDVNALFVAQIYATLIIVDKSQNIVKSVLKENNLTIAMQMRNFYNETSPHYHSNRRTTYTYGISRKCRFHEKHLLHANWQDGQRSINTPSTTIDKRRNFFANDRWRGEKLVRSTYCRYSKPEPKIIKIRCFFSC